MQHGFRRDPVRNYRYGDKIVPEEYYKIINSVEYFNFQGDSFGETDSLLNVYISVFYENKDNLESKLEFYSIILITFMHEVIEHVLMRIQQHLYDKNIKSPDITE